MQFSREEKVTQVIGPDGYWLTRANLPPPETTRWVIRRKAQVVAAVRGGLLSVEEACQLYRLNREEFDSWQYSIERYGMAGLRTTRTQFYVTSPKRLRSLKSRIPGMIGRPLASRD
jgi:hypothetical protein